MAKHHAAQTLNVQTKRLRPACQQPSLSRRELLGRPANDCPGLFRHRSRGEARHFRKHSHLTITLDEVHGNVEVEKTREGFAKHWAGHHVTPHDDAIYPGLSNSAEYGLQGRQVPVNIVERGDSHDTLAHPPQPSLAA
jgi:hypothetical protein